MTLLDAFLRYDIPPFIRRRAINRIVRLTAEAFGAAPPDVSGLKPEAVLQRYALFTREEVSRLRQHPGDIPAVQERLYTSSMAMASTYRKLLGVNNWDAAAAVSRKVYGYIGIAMDSSPRGDITISTCFFSRYYSPETCEVVSSLDSGMIAGLAGEGELTFTSRLTEGATCCRACFRHRRPQR